MTAPIVKMSFQKACILAMCAAGLWAGTIVLATFASGGAGLAARSATDFAMPVGILWLIFLAGCVMNALRKNTAIACLFAAAFLILGLAFNGSLTSHWAESTELVPTEQEKTAAENGLDVVVVLGGCARVNRFGVTELTRDGERLVSAAQMWHSGQTKLFVCTGTGHGVYANPSEMGREILVSLAVPDDAIFEVSGDNTSEEMVSLKEFFESPPIRFTQMLAGRTTPEDTVRETGDSPERPQGGAKSQAELKIGLSTSAFHLPRAIRLAATQGLEFVPLPCSFRGSVKENWTARDLIPNANAGVAFEIAWKETLARLVGR